jgi:uncharacterized protein YerC
VSKSGTEMTRAERIELHNRHETYADQVAEMFVRGDSYGQISKATGIPKTTVQLMCKRLTAAYARDRYGDTTSVLGRELTILDQLTRSNIARAKAGDATSARIVLDCHIRRSKLLGLDAAVKAEITVKTSTDIEIERLVRQLADAPVSPQGTPGSGETA